MKIVLFLVLAFNIFCKNIDVTFTDQEWYPFIYTEGGVPKGMHIDLVRDALNNLGYNPNFIMYPSRRGLVLLGAGQVDALVSLPYSEQYSNLYFPNGADKDTESEYRIMQVDQALINYRDSNYKYKGDLSTIPAPVRLIFGMEDLGAILEDKKIPVEYVRAYEQNFKKIMRDKNGSIVTTTMIAEKYFEESTYRQHMKIQAVPITSQSYFLAFSKSNSKLSEDEKLKIWEEIKRLREDYVYMLQVYARY